LPAQVVDEILALYDPQVLAAKLGPLWQEEIYRISAKELTALGLEPGFGAVNPLIETHLADFGLNRLAVPIGTSRTIANQAIIAGINNRESIGEIAARLRAVGATNSGYRSRLIARTEVVRSANVGRELSWRASQLPLVKRWISGLTETTRESHAALHMKTVPLNESFQFNAGLSPFRDGSPSVPGTSGVAAHDIQCICSSTAFDPEHKKRAFDFGSQDHVLWQKAIDEERRPWELAATKILEGYFDDINRETERILQRLAGA
jgi:hypothetical protein